MATKNIFTDDFGTYLYNRLPEYHRIVDKDNGNALEKFIEIMNEGAFIHNNKYIVDLVNLSQVNNCPDEYLEHIGFSLGADWITDIQQEYRRKLLSLLVKLYKKKGSTDVIKYISSEVSGVNVTVHEDFLPPDFIEEGDELRRKLTVYLHAPEDSNVNEDSAKNIRLISSHFIPVHTKLVILVTYFMEESFSGVYKEEHLAKVVNKIESIKDILSASGYTLNNTIAQGYEFTYNYNSIGDTKDITPILNTFKLNTNLTISPFSNQYNTLKITKKGDTIIKFI